ncbi:MAG: hypothetical protein RLZZ535_78, partial [Cyanobacteriota bacterium]
MLHKGLLRAAISYKLSMICPKQYPQMYALGLTRKTRRKFMMKLLDLAF